MGTERVLIIGSDRGYCLRVEEFLESRGLITTVVLDYKEGFEKLFYEKPDLVVLELISYEMSPALVKKINNSGHFELVDIKKGKVGERLKPVLVLEETEHLNTLFDFLKSYLDKDKTKSSPLETDAEEKGNLKAISYPGLLVNIHRDKRTGVLTINSRVKLKIYFADGIPVFAEEGDIETALGKMLLDSGKIPETGYQRAMDVAAEKGEKIGDVLIGMGLISPHELNGFLELQVKEKIISGFNYTRGTYSFKPGSDFMNRVIAYRVSLPRVLYEGIKRLMEIAYIEEIFSIKQGGNPAIELSPNLREEINGIGFSPRESRFIQLLKNRAVIKDIISTSRLSREETLKLLYFLHLLGLLKISEAESDIKLEKSTEEMNEEQGVKKQEAKLREEDVITLEEEITETELELSQQGMGRRFTPEEFKDPRNEETKMDKQRRKEALIDEVLRVHPTLNEGSYYEVLGVTKNSKGEEIKAAYFNLAKKFHPDAHPDLEKGIKEKAEEIFTKVTIAYQTLSDNEKRAQYDSQIEAAKLRAEVETSYGAEIAYKKGEVLLKQRKYIEAEEEFKKAVNLNPDEATYVGTLAWVKFVVAMDKDRVLNEVKKELQRAIALNPKIAQTYYYLGCVYKYAESEKEAVANFLKALEYNPEYIEAKRELWLIQMRKPEKEDKDKKDKGFWSNLFKK